MSREVLSSLLSTEASNLPPFRLPPCEARPRPPCARDFSRQRTLMRSPLRTDRIHSRAAENAALCVTIRFRLPKPRLDQATAPVRCCWSFQRLSKKEGSCSLSLSLSEKPQLAAPREGDDDDDHGAGGTGATTRAHSSPAARHLRVVLAFRAFRLTALVGEGVRR